MAQKETYHLPGIRLELEFADDQANTDDSDDFRRSIKHQLVQYLIKDGVAFEETDTLKNWKANGEADTRLESAIDAWIRAGRYWCAKAKDKHAKKVRWVLACSEQVTILLEPE